ncbi:MAG TPA: hypothetical protein VGN74_05530 [Brevundimonas sp.]|uniref:hypothetical protein n=1 Tax=Brevundimonas sp. TaxID=1871086 RepID=UPI002E1047E7|nr:hypothetical protein [Brevundimonas sp.]
MTKQAALSLYRKAEAMAGQEGSRKRWRMAAHALAPLTDDAAAQVAYATACASHKRHDWRLAARALAAALEGRQMAEAARPVSAPVRTTQGPSLVEFLAVAGMRDEGGELARMDAQLWHRDRAFRRRLIRADGMTYDAACDAAWERGYFDHVPAPTWSGSENMHAVTPAMLFEAIRRELAGRPVYACEAPELDALDDPWAPPIDYAFPGDDPFYAEAA